MKFDQLDHLDPADSHLFYSREDPDDPRLGDVVCGEPDKFPASAKVAIIGVPQDIGVRRNSGRPGASDGPRALRTALYRLAAFDIESRTSIPYDAIIDLGDVKTGGNLEQIHTRLEGVTAQVCAHGMVPLIFGGGHDITYAGVSGAYRHFQQLGAFNFDAHLDVRPPSPARNSGTSFRMLIDQEKINPARFIEFGIQPFSNARCHIEWLEGAGGRIRTLDTIRRSGIEPSLTAALRVCSAGREPYYGTLDLDAVEAGSAPGVSATMPDGFSAADLLYTATELGKDSNCIALDIAELNPAFDVDNRTAKLAAHAAARFITGVLRR